MAAAIPPPHSADSDDLLWALDTAKALLERGDNEGARGWLRRAAVTARNDGRLERAVELQRVAAELPAVAVGPSLSIPPIELDAEFDTEVDVPPPLPPIGAGANRTTPWDAELARMFAGFDPPVVAKMRACMTLWELRRDEEMPVPALLHVLAGSVSICPRLSDSWSKSITAASFLQGLGANIAHVDGRLVGRAPLSVVATFTEEAPQLIADYAPSFAADLAMQADAMGYRLALASGSMGERLDASVIEILIESMRVERVAPYAQFAAAGDSAQGLTVVVDGGLELLGPDRSVKGQVRVGQALFPESAMTGTPMFCDVRASSLGAVVLRATPEGTAELMATQPVFLEALLS